MTPPHEVPPAPSAGLLARIDAHITGTVSYRELAAVAYLIWVNLK